MTNVLICGVGTQAAIVYYKMNKKRNDIIVVCGVDKDNYLNNEYDFPVYKSFDEVREMVDVVIDFSSPDMLKEVLSFVKDNNCVLIEGVAGYTKKQKQQIVEAGASVPIFMSNYLSLGLNTFFKACIEAAKSLGADTDIEIIEKYYGTKINAPGATTITLAEEMNEVLGGTRKIVVGRSSCRKGGEICIHAVRGGNVVGELEVLFLGQNEVLSFRHEALTKSIYAESAMNLIDFMADKPNGFYNMKDYFNIK